MSIRLGWRVPDGVGSWQEWKGLQLWSPPPADCVCPLCPVSLFLSINQGINQSLCVCSYFTLSFCFSPSLFFKHLSKYLTLCTRLIFLFIKRFYQFFLERGREGEKHQCEGETSIGCLSYVPQPGTEPATQTCAQTGNRTCGPSLCNDAQPTEPPWSGLDSSFFHIANTFKVQLTSSLHFVLFYIMVLI